MISMSSRHTALAFILWMSSLGLLHSSIITHLSSLQPRHIVSSLLPATTAITDLSAVSFIWNSLPPDINMACTLISFKSPCSNVIFFNIYFSIIVDVQFFFQLQFTLKIILYINSNVILINEAIFWNSIFHHSIALACLSHGTYQLWHSAGIYWFIYRLPSLECRLQEDRGFICFIDCCTSSV